MKASLKDCSILHPFFTFTGSQHPSLQLVSQFSSTDLPPHHLFHSESTQICSQAKKKKCTCKCLNSFPLHPSLQVSIICPSQVSLQVIATILLPGLTMKPDNTFSQSSESVSHYDWHTNSQLEHITPTGIPLLSRLHSDSFWPSILNQVWTKGLRQKKPDVPPPGWHSSIPYVHLTAPEQQQEWDLNHKTAEAETVYFIMGKFNTLYDTSLSLFLN